MQLHRPKLQGLEDIKFIFLGRHLGKHHCLSCFICIRILAEQRRQQCKFLEDLPEELQAVVASKLSLADLRAFSQVSTGMYRQGSSNPATSVSACFGLHAKVGNTSRHVPESLYQFSVEKASTGTSPRGYDQKHLARK